jgi:hypothetical protein
VLELFEGVGDAKSIVGIEVCILKVVDALDITLPVKIAA